MQEGGTRFLLALVMPVLLLVPLLGLDWHLEAGATGRGCAPTDAGASGAAGLEAALRDLLGDAIDHYGVVLQSLDGGAGFSHQPQRVFYAASLYKLAVMYELFRQRDAGEVSFEEQMVVSEEAAAEDLGTLEPLGIGVGDMLSLGRLLELMITVSDNTSAVMLQGRLGGERVDLGLRELGLQVTSVRTPDLPTTAADMATLLAAIAEGRAVSVAASDEMAELLRRQTLRSWIPAGVPAEVAVGNKTGSWSDAAHDAAIVYAPFGTYVLAVLSDVPEESTTLAELSREIYLCLSPASDQLSAISNQGNRGETRADG